MFLGTPSEQGEGVGQLAPPGGGVHAGRSPEGFRVLAEMQNVHAGAEDCHDDLGEKSAELNCPAAGEGVVDERSGEVGPVAPQAGLVFIPRPHGYQRVRLEDEEMAGGPEKSHHLPGPLGEVVNPDESTLPV